MMELTAENFRRAIAGAIYTSRTSEVTVGAPETVNETPNDTLKIFTVDNSPVEENSEAISIDTRDPVLQVHLIDYTMNYSTGTIHFLVAPATGDVITVAYKYISGSAVISGETAEAYKAIIKDSAYIDSVAIVGTISNPDLPGTSQPVIIIIKNALCDSAFSLSMAPKDEAVPEVTFTAHYLPSDLDTEPWSIEYPLD